MEKFPGLNIAVHTISWEDGQERLLKGLPVFWANNDWYQPPTAEGESVVPAQHKVWIGSNTIATLSLPNDLHFPRKAPMNVVMDRSLGADESGWMFGAPVGVYELFSRDDDSYFGWWKALGYGAGWMGEPLLDCLKKYLLDYADGNSEMAWVNEAHGRMQFAQQWALARTLMDLYGPFAGLPANPPYITSLSINVMMPQYPNGLPSLNNQLDVLLKYHFEPQLLGVVEQTTGGN